MILAVRDYTQGADKHCLLKMPDIKPSDLSLWQDHLQKVSAEKALRQGNAEVIRLDNESVQKQFEADLYKVSLDTATFLQHVEMLEKGRRASQLARVCHIRAESKRGSSEVVDFMQKCCRHEVGLFQDTDAVETIKKAGSMGTVAGFRASGCENVFLVFVWNPCSGSAASGPMEPSFGAT